MAFVNEYIKIEDIDTYELFELGCKYSWALQHETKKYFLERKRVWTIDRERDVWLKLAISINDNDHRPTGYMIYTLYIQGRYYEVILQSLFSESGIVSEGVRAVTWKLVSIRPTPEEEFANTDEQIKLVEEALKNESSKHFSDQGVIEVLKEALNIYGMNGQTGPHGIGDTHIKVDNIIVTLKV